MNTFAVGTTPVARRDPVPLYVSFEDGSSGLSNVYLMASYDGGADLVDAVPGERQRRPDRGASAQPARGAERHRGGRRSTTGGSPARRAGAPTSPARASPSTRARTAARRTTASTRRSSSTTPSLDADRPQHPPIREDVGSAALGARTRAASAHRERSSATTSASTHRQPAGRTRPRSRRSTTRARTRSSISNRSSPRSRRLESRLPAGRRRAARPGTLDQRRPLARAASPGSRHAGACLRA